MRNNFEKDPSALGNSFLGNALFLVKNSNFLDEITKTVFSPDWLS